MICKLQHYVYHAPEELNQIAIIAIDDSTLKAVKARWPWERKVFAEILEKISSLNPKIIYLNFTFAGESKNVEDDMLLSASINKAGNIVLSSYYDANGELVSPLDAFRKAAKKTGFINKVNDEDGVVRRFHPFIKTEEGGIENYAVELCILSGLYNIDEKEIGSNIPLKKDGSVNINYLVYPAVFKTYSLIDIFNNKIDPKLLNNKIILFGGTTEILHDTYDTPIGNMPGVYITANTLTTLLSKRFLKEFNYSLFFCLIAALSLLTGIITFKNGIIRGIFIVFIFSILIFIISFLAFRRGILLDWFSPFVIIFITSISVSFLRYITILKMQVIEIKNAQEEIVRREQLSTIGKLTSMIIHEMNNPLANLKDLIERLTKKIQGNEDINRIIFLIQQEILRAKKVGEELKYSYTPHSDEKKPANINKLVQDVIEAADQGIKSKGIDLKINLAEQLPLIPVSLDKIKQVLLNIILNAVDAVEAGKHIYINTVLFKNEWVDIIVKDEGCGIPKEELSKIFNAFHTTKKHRKGTGLGLFISYEIIKAHRGEILVESEVGKGTTFIIRLPLAEAIYA